MVVHSMLVHIIDIYIYMRVVNLAAEETFWWTVTTHFITSVSLPLFGTFPFHENWVIYKFVPALVKVFHIMSICFLKCKCVLSFVKVFCYMIHKNVFLFGLPQAL